MLVQGSTGTNRDGNLWLPRGGVGISTQQDLKEMVLGDPDFKVAVSGRLRLCPWSQHQFLALALAGSQPTSPLGGPGYYYRFSFSALPPFLSLHGAFGNLESHLSHLVTAQLSPIPSPAPLSLKIGCILSASSQNVFEIQLQ